MLNEKSLLKRIPWWGWVLGIGLFALQFGLYSVAYRLSVSLGTINHAWSPKIPAIDDMVHLVPVFVLIYVFSYVFWICAPVAVSLTRKSNLVNYVTGLLLAYIIGFCIFAFLPSYMDRTAEGLMNVSANDGFFSGILAWVYSNDGSSMAYNLCPSFHCMISTYSYLGVRKQAEISKGYRVYSVIMAVLICLSTQFTKQHYFVDMIAGISLAVICYVLVAKADPGKKYN